MTPQAKEIPNEAVHRQESLRVSGGFEPPHLSLALAGRLMRDFGSIVLVLRRAVHNGRHHDAVGRRVAAKLVGDQTPWRTAVAVLHEASRGATPSATTPVVLADAGVENVNAQIDDLITTGVLRRVLAFTELKFSNSMIEAWWRSLKHQWLFLHSLESVTTARRLVTFYVDEHNRVLPHSAFRGQTPDEMYFGTGDAVPADLTSRAAGARRTRVETNRSASCERCPSIDAAA